MPVRVTFDSNAWEPIFGPTVTEWTPIHAALADGTFKGFICEAGFRIEAVTKKNRATYFAQPHFGSRIGIVERDSRPYLHMSFGPEDDHHPGLPPIQAAKLQEALRCGIRLMRASAWMGLPAPQELLDPTIFVPETRESANQRIQRQIDVSANIEARGVGKAAFDMRLEDGTFCRQRQSIKNDLAKHVPNGRTEKRSQPMSATATMCSVLKTSVKEHWDLQFSIMFIVNGSHENSAFSLPR